MIAEIIPHARTPRTLTVFDYEIPEGMALRVGDCVCVPFRNSSVLGVVWNIKEKSQQTAHLRSIESVFPVSSWHSLYRRKWLEWFARWYAISLPHAFKTLQHAFPKRVKPHTQTQDGQMSLDIAALPHRVVSQRYTTILEWYKKTIRRSSTHTLLLCGEYADVRNIEKVLPKKNTHIIQRATPKQLTDLERLLHESIEPHIVIGTKQLIGINPCFFGTIIIDQEESSSHKQRDLNPRFHIRRAILTADALAREHGEYFPRVILTSIAPSIETTYAVKNKLMTSEMLVEADTREPNVRIISMEEEKQRGNYSWFSEEVQNAVLRSHKALLFLNRTGEYSYVVCQECSTILPPNSLRCSNCKSTQLKNIRKGITQLESEAQELFVSKKVVRIDRTIDEKQIESRLASADIVFATEKILHATSLDIFDYCAILSIDHVLSYPHYSAFERIYQLLRTFFSSGIPCDLQTHSPHHPVITYASNNAYEQFADNELLMRKLLNAPPYGYRARIIHTKNHTSRVVIEPPQHTLPQHEVLDPEY